MKFKKFHMSAYLPIEKSQIGKLVKRQTLCGTHCNLCPHRILQENEFLVASSDTTEEPRILYHDFIAHP